MGFIKAVLEKPCRLFNQRTFSRLKSSLEHLFYSYNETREHPTTVYFDVSKVSSVDNKTGISRVVRSLLSNLLVRNKGFRIVPVAAYFFTEGYFIVNTHIVDGELLFKSTRIKISPTEGDFFISFEDEYNLQTFQREQLKRYRNDGCKIWIGLHDMIPIYFSEYYPKHFCRDFERWLLTVANFSNFICVSRSTQIDLLKWLTSRNLYTDKIKVKRFPLGCDLPRLKQMTKLSKNPEKLNINFLMVGTLEPRKNYSLVVEAFDFLWKNGFEGTLTIVGKYGWMMNKLKRKLENHPLLNKRLFYLGQISDTQISEVYKNSDCVIMASTTEGYGLPIVEASNFGCYLILNDIPIFKEVAGAGAFFIKMSSPLILAEGILNWSYLFNNGDAPKSLKIKQVTWDESCEIMISEVTQAQ
jgi:glycosyltransferase involved in cell wall biosynthesis